MRSIGPQTAFEVYCYSCHVTAPVGMRRCVHCGGQLSRQRMQPDTIARIDLEDPFEESEPPAEPTQRSGTNLPMTAVWILLLIGGSLYRLCG